MAEPSNNTTETPALDTDITTPHQPDVKQAAEETAPAETKPEESAPVPSESSSGVEAAADITSSLPAAEAPAEPKQVEEEAATTAMEQDPTESTEAAAAASE